jgi:hypothetical protein
MYWSIVLCTQARCCVVRFATSHHEATMRVTSFRLWPSRRGIRWSSTSDVNLRVAILTAAGDDTATRSNIESLSMYHESKGSVIALTPLPQPGILIRSNLGCQNKYVQSNENKTIYVLLEMDFRHNCTYRFTQPGNSTYYIVERRAYIRWASVWM